MEKGFFKVFNPESSAQRLKIPTSFIDYKNGKLPRKVSLRDRFGNMWPIGVTKTGRDFYFQYGWEKFIEDNTLEFGDFLIFDYDGHGTFDLKLLGITGCEKKGAGGEKNEEEMNVEHRKSVKPKGKNRASASSNSSSDDSAEEYMVEEEEEDEYEEVVEEDDDEEEEEKEEEEGTEKASRSKRRYVDEEDNEEEEDEEENERAGTFKKKVPRSKARCKRATAHKVRNHHDQYGADIFKSGCATQPKNPYFVAKIRPKRTDQLYIPNDVVRDYKLELPSNMTIHDSAGRKFETKLKIWKDGRKWLIGGWRSLCKWNLVEKDDTCICEFVRGKRDKGLYLQVQVIYEGSSSHPNKK